MADDPRPSPEEIILYDKDPATKIATITFNRPEYLNAPTSAARLRYADLLRGATVDDDVKASGTPTYRRATVPCRSSRRSASSRQRATATAGIFISAPMPTS